MHCRRVQGIVRKKWHDVSPPWSGIDMVSVECNDNVLIWAWSDKKSVIILVATMHNLSWRRQLKEICIEMFTCKEVHWVLYSGVLSTSSLCCKKFIIKYMHSMVYKGQVIRDTFLST